MVADFHYFSVSSSSIGGWEVPWRWLNNGSYGAASINQRVECQVIIPNRHVAPSLGSLVIEYGRQLIATASAHTVLDSFIVPLVILDSVEAGSPDEAVPVRPLFEEVAEMAALTGLPKVRIANDLIGVSRQAYYDWLAGKRVSLEKERQIRGTLDVLRRASVHYANPELLRGWLVTPVGSRAIAPIDLLKAGKIDEARLLSVSSLPKRAVALPEWLLTAPVNDWSEREQKRRGSVLRERDAISRDATNE